MIVYNIRNGLGVGGGAGPAAPDSVVDLCEFVGNAVGDVGAGGGTRVGSEYDTVGEVYGHAVGNG